MTVWAHWVIATIVGSSVVVAIGFICSFFWGAIVGIFLPWFLSLVTVPIAQWLWMRRKLRAFSAAWVVVYFSSCAIGFFVAVGAIELAGERMLGVVLASAVSGYLIGAIQTLALPRVLALSDSQNRSLGYKWAAATAFGLIVGGAISEALMITVTSVGWFLFPIIVSTTVAACQGYVLQGLFSSDSGLQGL